MDTLTTVVQYTIDPSARPTDPLEWYEQWFYNGRAAECPLRPVRKAAGWFVPVITNIKVKYNLDFQSRLFGPEALIATGGGEYKQRIILAPVNGMTNYADHPRFATWFYEEVVSWLPVADIPVEGIEINYPGNDWIEEIELPIYRDSQFILDFENSHQLPDIEPLPPLLEGFPPPQGTVYITLEYHWREMTALDFGIARTRDSQKVYG